MPSNLIPIVALTQSIENELAWWRIEPKSSEAFPCFFSVSTTRPRRRSENRTLSVAFKYRIRSICIFRHCNAYILVISLLYCPIFVYINVQCEILHETHRILNIFTGKKMSSIQRFKRLVHVALSNYFSNSLLDLIC